MGLIKVRVNNWGKYQTRKDVKRCYWFRMDHDFFDNPDTYKLDPETIALWLFILCLASRKNCETVQIDPEYTSHRTGIQPANITDRILILCKIGWLTRVTRHVHVTCSSRTRALHNRTEQDKTRQNRKGEGKQFTLPLKETPQPAEPPPEAESAPPPPPPTRSPVDAAALQRLQETWLETLRVFGITRPILPHEQMTLAEAALRLGAEPVALALEGARYEPMVESFDPQKWVSLRRTLDYKNYERFINLASQKKQLDATRAARAAPPPPQTEPHSLWQQQLQARRREGK